MKVLSLFRAILLCITMTILLIIINATNVITQNSQVGIILIGLPALYLVVELLSFIYQLIINHKDITNNFLIALYNAKFHRVLSFFRKLTMLGFITLCIGMYLKLDYGENLFVLGKEFNFNGALLDVLNNIYIYFIKWCSVSYILCLVLTVLLVIAYLPHEGDGAYTSLQTLFKFIFTDVTSIFTNVVKIFTDDEHRIKHIVSVIFYGFIIVFCVICTVMLL